jgi:hypothetical protein
MFIRNLLRCAIALTVAMPLYALADSFNAKPGAWEITTTTLTKGMLIPAQALANMPPAQRARVEQSMQARSGKPSTHVTKSCVTKTDLDQDRVLKSDDEENCKKKIVSKSASKIVYEQTCTAPNASKSTVKVEAMTPESIAASMDMVQGGAGGKIHVDIKGRWLGASCAGIKDNS